MRSPLDLLFLSLLEKHRVRETRPDLTALLPAFKTLETLVSHSIAPPQLTQTRTPEGTPLLQAKTVERPFQDESLLKKLVQFRSQIPLSTRIIRAGDA
jgi:hypothetical protein